MATGGKTIRLSGLYALFIGVLIIIIMAATVWMFLPWGERAAARLITTSYVATTPVVEWDELFDRSGVESRSPDDRVLRPDTSDLYLPTGEYLHIVERVHVRLERLNETKFRFTFSPVKDSEKARSRPFRKVSESPVYVISDEAVPDANGIYPGRQVTTYEFTLDIPDGDYGSRRDPTGVFLKPEIQLTRVSNMSVGSLTRYSLDRSDNPNDTTDRFRLNQGVYDGVVTANAKALWFDTRYQLAQEKLDFGDQLLISRYSPNDHRYNGLHASITGSITLLPHSNLMGVDVHANNSQTSIRRDDGGVVGNYTIMSTPWNMWVSQPIIQILVAFFATLATLLSFMKENWADGWKRSRDLYDGLEYIKRLGKPGRDSE